MSPRGPNPDHTDEPMDIRTTCVAVHEMFTSLQSAGFTYDEALYLVGCQVSGGPRAMTDGEGT